MFEGLRPIDFDDRWLYLELLSMNDFTPTQQYLDRSAAAADLPGWALAVPAEIGWEAQRGSERIVADRDVSLHPKVRQDGSTIALRIDT